MLSETAARWGLVLHAVLGAAAVGATTHLVLWLRKYLRGEYGRRRAVQRFAWYSVILHVLAFTAGNVVYPTYRVEIRAAYLEHPARIAEDRAAKAEALAAIAAGEGTEPYQDPPIEDVTRRANAATRWFDIKEHWTALGMFASLSLALVLAFWNPKTEGPALKPVVMGLAVTIAGTVWFAAIVGILTSAWRGV